jgi:hypothetical protein
VAAHLAEPESALPEGLPAATTEAEAVATLETAAPETAAPEAIPADATVAVEAAPVEEPQNSEPHPIPSEEPTPPA